MPRKYKIVSLNQAPEYAPVCAAWSFTEWGCQIAENTLEKGVERYKNTAEKTDKTLPLTWVCMTEDNKPAGMASLKKDDHPDHKDIFPWLASVFVHPEHRGNGLARNLFTHVEDAAKELGYKKIYLFTHTAEKLYEKNGWQKEGSVRDPTGLRDQPDILMSKNL